MKDLEKLINEAFENKELLNESIYKEAVKETIDLLDKGKVRVATQISQGNWKVNEWVKKAILLYFAITKLSSYKVVVAKDDQVTHLFEYFDKIPLKQNYKKHQVRVVPPATVRYGAFVEKGAVLMPCYINIGAYVGSGTMVDTWATVGSCAQVGRNCHIAGGVGIGGVLEPPSAKPVIIEDNCFIGSRCIIVEGAIIEEGAVLGANVTITGSTRIIDTQTGKIYRGRVPAYSVVIPGTYKKEFPSGTYYVSCALIIGKRTEKTDKKVELNDILREFDIEF